MFIMIIIILGRGDNISRIVNDKFNKSVVVLQYDPFYLFRYNVMMKMMIVMMIFIMIVIMIMIVMMTIDDDVIDDDDDDNDDDESVVVTLSLSIFKSCIQST